MPDPTNTTADNSGPFTCCSHGGCVAVVPTATGYDLISTLGTDRGRVSYDPAEVATFLTDVQAGKWDHILNDAKARAATLAAA